MCTWMFRLVRGHRNDHGDRATRSRRLSSHPHSWVGPALAGDKEPLSGVRACKRRTGNHPEVIFKAAEAPRLRRIFLESSEVRTAELNT